MKITRSFSIRIEDELLQKLHFVSEYDGRSANSEVLFFIRKGILAFENEHGKIESNQDMDSQTVSKKKACTEHRGLS